MSMYCPECGESITPDEKTCHNCGVPLGDEQRCPECGAELPPGAAACPVCGCPASLPSPASPVQSAAVPGTVIIAAPSGQSGALAICAMVLCFLFPPAGFVLGLVGLFVYGKGTNRGLCIAAVSVSAVLMILITIALCKIIPIVNQRLEELQRTADSLTEIVDGVSGAAQKVISIKDKISVFIDVVKDFFR